MADFINPLAANNANIAADNFRKDLNSAISLLNTFSTMDHKDSLEKNKKGLTETHKKIQKDYRIIISNPLIDTEKKTEINNSFQSYIEKYANIQANYFEGGRKTKKSHKKRKHYKSKKGGKSRKHKTKR
jgi:hypothetical protein